MRVAQILAEGAPEYERKHQRIDAAEAVPLRDAQAAHVYAPKEFPASLVRDLRVPYVASGMPKQGWRKVAEPRIVLTHDVVPEAVEDAWFTTLNVAAGFSPPYDALKRVTTFVIGSFGRPSVKNAIEQSLARMHRFRDDIEWHVFNEPPSPRDVASVNVWVDPATSDDDLDGFTAEALVIGVPVVATRTQINLQRTEKGNNAFVVPANDANELTHAILAALFKPEVATMKIEAARRTAAKFRPRQRRRVLDRIYQQLIERP